MNQHVRTRLTDEFIERLFRLGLSAGMTEARLRHECGLMSHAVLQMVAKASDEELLDGATGVLPEKCPEEDLKRKADFVDRTLRGQEDDRLRFNLRLLSL